MAAAAPAAPAAPAALTPLPAVPAPAPPAPAGEGCCRWFVVIRFSAVRWAASSVTE
jgi:hypothetical protein